MNIREPQPSRPSRGARHLADSRTTTVATTVASTVAAAFVVAACSTGDGTGTTNTVAATTIPESTTAAGVGTDAGTGTDAVTLVLDWTPNTNHGGVYLAEANGWYDEAGIDLSIIQPGANGGLQALGGGDADFAISVQEEITPARAAGLPVVSIAAIIAHNTSSLMSLADSDITRPADVAGHRYGGWGGQLEQAIVDSLVSCDGGDPADVEFVSVGDADYRVGLERGDYDVVWIFDGWDKIRFEQEGIAINTIEFADYPDCVPDWYTPLIATSEQHIEGDPDLVQRFMDATTLGYQAAMADPAAAADALLAAAPELDAELVNASASYLAERFAAEPQQWGRQDPDVWVDFTAFLEDAEIVTEPVDPAAAFTNAFVEGAEDAAVPSSTTSVAR